MSYELAVAEDRAGHVEQAATAYEEAFAQRSPPLDGLMNLVVLYWQSTEYGFWTGHRLSSDFVTRAGTRFGHWLTIAVTLYPGAGEPRFWQKYIPWADLGEVLSSDDCKEILSKDPTALAPAMHIFASSQGQECVEEATRLLEQCHNDGTTRAKYIESVIEGVLKRNSSAARH